MAQKSNNYVFIFSNIWKKGRNISIEMNCFIFKIFFRVPDSPPKNDHQNLKVSVDVDEIISNFA